MKFTYYGHASFAIEAAGKTLLFDPFITPNPLTEGKVDAGAIAADAILLSHGHQDHIVDAPAIAKRTGATVVAPYEVGLWAIAQGVPESQVMPMNHGGAHTFPFGRIKLTNAVHSSSFPDGSYAGHPCGFVVETDEGRFYYAGDTALSYDMKLVAEEGPVQFAVLPIGDFFTMGAADAAKAATFAGTGTAVGVHYNTFPPITIEAAAAKKSFADAAVTLHLPAIGETIEI